MPCSGVRSSWLTAATNALFARVGHGLVAGLCKLLGLQGERGRLTLPLLRGRREGACEADAVRADAADMMTTSAPIAYSSRTRGARRPLLPDQVRALELVQCAVISPRRAVTHVGPVHRRHVQARIGSAALGRREKMRSASSTIARMAPSTRRGGEQFAARGVRSPGVAVRQRGTCARISAVKASTAVRRRPRSRDGSCESKTSFPGPFTSAERRESAARCPSQPVQRRLAATAAAYVSTRRFVSTRLVEIASTSNAAKKK